MKTSHIVAPALAAILAVGCATTSRSSATDRAEQAERDRAKAQDQARDARRDADNARLEAQDATRAQHEADQKAQWEAQRAAQAERDAQLANSGGVAERQVDIGTPMPGLVSSGVSFTATSADLSADTKARLDEIARGLRAHPSRTVVVEGYADDTGIADNDVKLSHKRAEAVAHYLESDGVASSRIATRGYGAHKVASTDAAVRERTPNRRVEVVFSRRSRTSVPSGGAGSRARDPWTGVVLERDDLGGERRGVGLGEAREIHLDVGPVGGADGGVERAPVGVGRLHGELLKGVGGRLACPEGRLGNAAVDPPGVRLQEDAVVHPRVLDLRADVAGEHLRVRRHTALAESGNSIVMPLLLAYARTLSKRCSCAATRLVEA